MASPAKFSNLILNLKYETLGTYDQGLPNIFRFLTGEMAFVSSQSTSSSCSNKDLSLLRNGRGFD